MDILKLKVLLKFRSHLPLEEEEIYELNKQIPDFQYPIGALYFILQEVTEQLYWESYEECYEYITNITSAVYKDYYTEDELVVINIFLALFLSDSYAINAEQREIIAPILTLETNKADIISMLHDIKYKYVLSLITRSKTSSEEILPYISSLESSTVIDTGAIARQKR